MVGLVETASAIRRGEMTSRGVVEACLRRAEKLQARLNFSIAIDAEGAISRAIDGDRAFAAGQPHGRLHGVALAHKDIFRRIGQSMSCGSAILRDSPPERCITATVIKRLEDAGAIAIARLNMAEFAIGPTGENRHFGACRNPLSLDHAAGGSSSGSAAAVAAGIVPASLCSDTGGSARLPAAMCGVVGLKVTNSAVSRYGMMGLSRSLDAVGIIASTSQDVAAILEVISGPDARDSSCSARPAYCSARQRPKVIGLRIGIPQNYYWEEISSEVADQLDGVVSRLNKLGMKTVKIDVPFHDVIPALAGILFACEAATLHAHWMHTQPGNYSEEVMARLEPGLHIPAHRYLQALHSRSELAAKFVEEVFNQADVLLTPALRNPIPLLAEVQSLATPSKLEAISKLTHCTRPINFLGLPALVLPCGSTRDGLPVGFQLIGRPFAEGLLLDVADKLEAECVANGPKMVATQ